MIILAAAIILSISGNDIRGKAEEAISATDIAAAKETVAVARSEWEVNYYKLKDKYDDSFKKYAEEKLKSAGIDYVSVSNEGAVNTIYTDKNGHTAIIPEGFSVSQVVSEQTIDYGLVIVDEDGNEFVWVPVDDINLFKRTTKYTGTTITDPDTTYSEPVNNVEIDRDAYGEPICLKLSLSNDLTGEWAEWTAMKAIVEDNKGFYIARYEAGKEGTSTVVSKKGATVWNNIPWGISMTEIGTEGAVYRARQMHKGSKSVVSTLCYSVQWDSALRFISNRGIADKTYASNSTGKGYYSYDVDGNLINPHEVQKTGSNDDYSFNNIYDMAGNVMEWTMESYGDGVYSSYADRMRRGGYYDLNGKWEPAGARYSCSPQINGGDITRFSSSIIYKIKNVYLIYKIALWYETHSVIFLYETIVKNLLLCLYIYI